MKTNSTILKTTIAIFLCSIFILGCSDSENIKKITKEYSYFYPVEDIKDATKHETIYLPVYSHVYTSEEKYEPMGITLSIRNSDSKENVYIEDISYYSTSGDLIETYISKTHLLKPMASIDFVIDLNDMRGGSGANFIIKWAGIEKLSTPIIQAVMVNNSGNKAFAFITNGQIVQ